MTEARGKVSIRLHGLMRKELLALSRDMHGLAALFLMPLMFIIIMSLALQNLYRDPVMPRNYAVLDLDEGAPALALLAQWRKDQGSPHPLPSDWHNALASGDLAYVLVIDRGFSSAVSNIDSAPAQHASRARILTEPGISAATLMAAHAKLERAVGALRARVLIANLAGLSPPPQPNVQDLVEVQRWAAGPRPSAVQQNVPAWLVFGMFFVVASLASLFVEERRCGALSRLLGLGVTPSQLLIGKALPYLGVNALQAALMLAAGAWLVPWLGGDALSFTGVDLPALALMLACISAAAVGLALLLAVIVRTSAQALAVGPLLNVLMAALGGIMVPTFVMPAAMQSIARLSPMNWALEGLLTVLLRGGGVTAVAPHALPLLALAACTLGTAALLMRRQLSP